MNFRIGTRGRRITGFGVLSLAAVAAAVLGLARAEPGPAPDAKAADPPPGDLLIAAARIQDPRFHHTVILLLRHDKDGAFGVVINRPVGERSIADLLAAAGDAKKPKSPVPEGTIRIFAGGPVQPELGFVVHSAEYRRDSTLPVDDQVAMTASREVLRDIGLHRGPGKSLFALGYAGWGAGQLEAEIARHDWFTAPDDPQLVFDDDRSDVWQHALSRRLREL
ncbi:MAG TPA: YqgE/AlgH family protein [Stellaceae bacterium]|nr:YqgE/AlgH family protein [Stellaceae bacterium]